MSVPAMPRGWNGLKSWLLYPCDWGKRRWWRPCCGCFMDWWKER